MKKILIVKPSSLGDVVHGMRIVRQIKIAFPESEIHWVIKKGLEGILDTVGWVDKYFIFERGRGFFPYIKLISEIRKFEYDCCLDLQGLLRSSVITKFSNSELKLGRADGRELSTLFYKTVGCPSRKSEMHAIVRLTPFLHKLGISKYDQNLPLNFGSRPLDKSKRKSIILFPESRRTEKIWPHFQELADWLKQKYSWNVIIAGTKKDNKFSNCIDLRGTLKIPDLINHINKSSIVVCNDSAPLHIASAVGTSILGLFGPTEPKNYGPYPLKEGNNYILSSKSKKIADIYIEDVKSTLSKAINSL